MKIILPRVDYTFDCGCGTCCSVIIENQKLFYDTVSDIAEQIQGNDGLSVLSSDNKVLPIAKSAELIVQFVPFDMNQKNLITKINSQMQRIAVDEMHHMKTGELLAEWERYLMNLSLEMVGNFEFPKISAESLIKAAGINIDNCYDNLGEQLLDYFELVHEYCGQKLFILVNLRSYMSDEETDLFLKSILERHIQILMLEGNEHPALESECRHIVDADLCVLC